MIEKNSVPVCHAITVLILENHNRVIRLFPRQRMRPGGCVAHPQTTARIKLKRHRVRNGKVHLGGKQIDLIARRHLHHRQLCFRGLGTPRLPILLHSPERLGYVTGNRPGCGCGKPDWLPVHWNLSPDISHSRFLRLPDLTLHVLDQLTGLFALAAEML